MTVKCHEFFGCTKINKTISAILSFFIGSIFLCFFSTFQKMFIGAPLILKGYLLPFFIGGTSGLLFWVWILKLRESRLALQKINDESACRVNRTRELETEIEDRKQIEQELRDRDERSHGFSRASFEGIVITKQGRIIEANDTVCKICGYEFSELLGMLATDLISPEEREHVKAKMLSGYELPYETSCLRKDGSILPLEVQAKNILYMGQQVRVAALHDITDRKCIEKKLKGLNNELEFRIRERTCDLEKKNIALSEILSRLEIEKQNIANKVDLNVQKLVFPILNRLINKSSTGDAKYLLLVKHNLDNITSSLGDKLSSARFGLTLREIEICALIKGNFSTKEIANLQNLSERTVETHRFNIRNKLGIKSAKINLASYLHRM